jgi:hypothetical protein
MAKLSNKEKAESKGFLLDLFWQGNLIQPGDTSIGNDLSYRWHNMHRCTAQVNTVCTEIVQRNFDFLRSTKLFKTFQTVNFL